MECFPFGVMALIIGAVLIWNYQKQRSATESWRSFASTHGLEFMNGGWFGQHEMQGMYRGISVRTYTETRGSGKNKTTYTVHEASLPDDVPFDLVVFEEHLLSGVVDMFGGQDIQIGDAEVDDEFVFRSDRPVRIKEFFDNREVLEAFRELTYSRFSVKIDHGVLKLEVSNLMTDESELREALDEITTFVDDLDGALAEDEPDPGPESDSARSSTEGRRSSGESDESVDEEFAVEW